jgi:hypothetical protein
MLSRAHVFLLLILAVLAQDAAAQASALGDPSSALVTAFGRSGGGQQSPVALRGTAQYEQLNGDYLSEFNSDIEPLAIFLPRSTADVAKFVNIIRPFALAGAVRFAVRGGGQQPSLACNNIQNGITIDLRYMAAINVDTKAKSVSLQAGVRWGAVYEVLAPLGLGVTGGRSTTNGVGGLVLSGGLSFFSSREGFIADNVLEFEVVLASGQVVSANPRSNPDLYKALRGGGNNFGIVTRVTLRTFPQTPFYGGSVFYFPDSFPSQIEAIVTELKKPDATPETHLMISIAYSASFAAFGGSFGLNQVYYTRQDGKGPAVLAPFTNIQPQIDQLNSVRNVTLVEAALEQTSQNTNNQRVAYMNLHVKADVATLRAAADIHVDGTRSLQSVTNITASLTFQPYPVSLLQKSGTNGGNVLGLGPSSGPIMSVLLLTWWDDPADDAKVLAALRDVLQRMRTDASARGTLIPFEYMNYASDFQDVISSYGASNKRFLQDTSRKYDPAALFQKGVPGGWKLFP